MPPQLPLIALILLTLLYVPHPATAEQQPATQPATLAITRTFDQLRHEPPIRINDDQIHLGLETERAPHGTAVLLYALTRNPTWNESPPAEDVLGPFHVRVRFTPAGEALEQIKEVTSLIARAKFDFPANHDLLFAHAIPLPEPGQYTVTLTRPDGTEAARATIHATEEPAHRWFRLYDVKPDPDANPVRDDNAPPLVHVAPDLARPAHPTFDGAMPLHLTGQLPRALPDEPSSTFKLTRNADTNTLILTADQSFIADPADHFLARWWINDKPFTAPEAVQQLQQQAEQVALSRELHLKLHLDPATLPAKPGDKISLQLLYAPTGISDFPRHHMLQELRAARSDEQPPLPHLTNRLDWTLPND